MNPEIRAQWTAALRSGEYQQTTGALRNGEGFCCMGVLCDIAVKQEIIDEPDKTGDGPVHVWYSYDGAADVLPESVAVWAGLTASDNRNPSVAYRDDMQNPRWARRGWVSLGELNDNGATFSQIADLVDANL